MASLTHPYLEYDYNRGMWYCEMQDFLTGRTWGSGYGYTRQEAIYSARRDQPSRGIIQRSIGWVVQHPFTVGAAVGVYVAYRRGKRGYRPRLQDYAVAGAVAGTITWAVVRTAQFLKRALFG